MCEGGVHTAGSASQGTDSAAGVLLASEDGLRKLGVRPRARIVVCIVYLVCLVGLVYLGYLVCLVDLVCSVTLVFLVWTVCC